MLHTFAGAAPADITNPSAGIFKLDVSCVPSVAGVEGLWSYTFIGTGSASDVQPGTWRVQALDQARWYVGPEELKDRLGQIDTATDSILTSVCLATSRWIDRYCVVPETPVLTADLRWVPAGSLAEGDELVGVDEYPTGNRYPKRHYRRAQVRALPRRLASCTRLILEDGRVVTSADEHRWLVRRAATYEWMHASAVREGDEIASPLRVWDTESSFEDGWVSGIFDGEGWIHRARPGSDTRNGTGGHLGVAQNVGPVLDRICRYLKEAEIPYRFNSGGRDCQKAEIYQRWASMEILGRLQPMRLMPRAAEVWEGGLVMNKGRPNAVRVIATEDAGVREVVSLGTSTGTYIANGLISHNCGRHFFRFTDTRTYQPQDIWLLTVDDLVSVTTLKVDLDGDGIYETTWTQNNNYMLRVGDNEFNQLTLGEPKPFTQVQVIGGSTWFPFTWPFVHLDRVQITGVFGWPQVPPVVAQAALLIASDWFKLKDAPFGVAGIADVGVLRVQSNPWIHEQLRPYCRPRGRVGV